MVASIALSPLTAACGKTEQPQPPPQAPAGTSGSTGTAGASGTGGGAGVTLSEAPPFAIPTASPPTLAPCDSLTVPEPVGFLPDGRSLVVQRLRTFDQEPAGDLIRAWDPSTNQLETLVVTQPGAGLQLSASGDRLFELSSFSASVRGYRAHELGAGAVTSTALIAVLPLGISGDGSFVLDEKLRRLTAVGESDFDFAPLLSELVRGQARYAALSFAGDAIAVPWRELEAETWNIDLAYDDGSVVNLGGAPVLDDCGSAFDRSTGTYSCAVSFSHDDRYVLAVRHSQLRVWDTATAAMVLALDGPQVRWASFVPGADRVLVVGESETIEHSIDGAEQLSISIDDYRFATGPEATLGYLDGALVVASRDQVLARWWQPQQTWPSTVAVTEDTAFAILPDREFDAPFPIMVARYARNIAGPTALFRPQETQSEWEGQVTLSPDEHRVAVAFPDSVRVLDSATLELLITLPTGAGTIAWSPDGRYLATSPDLHYRDPKRPDYVLNKTLSFWNAASGELAASYVTPVHTHAFAFSADGAKIVAWGQDMETKRSELSALEGTLTQFTPTGEPRSFTLDVVTGQISDNTLGPFVGSTREIVATEQGIFRVSTGELVSVFEPFASEEQLPRQVVFAPDASVGAIRGPLEQGQLFAVIDAERTTNAPFRYWPANLALSPGGRRFAVGEDIYCASPP